MENKIIEDILESIKNGAYDNEKILPSENELVCCYHVPRHRVRVAYERLEAMGYIVTKAGIGRYAKVRKNRIEIHLSGSESFTDKMHRLGYHLETKLIDCSIVDYDMPAFRGVKNKDDSIIRFSRLRMIDGEAAAIHTSYVLKSRFPNMLKEANGITSMFGYYNANGYSNFHYDESILTSALPTNKQRQLLKCPSLVPVLILETQCFDRVTHDLIEFTRITYRGDRFICHLSSKL